MDFWIDSGSCEWYYPVPVPGLTLICRSYEPVLSQTIVASVDAALAGAAPAGVESIRMTTFTRGCTLLESDQS
jgi:hypothetical protein